ncbi:MAG: hypothetical protein LBU12_09155 [Deltaproteobacteria bacterium]|jgi:hypothetical protein|nr:hypothetical protein [Deltaproteobacteria bacterium]
MFKIILATFMVLMTVDAYADQFNGYECTFDCSGHKAGYKWAEKNNIGNTNDCAGNSNSFNEGCRSYVEENGSSYNDYHDHNDDNDGDDDDDGYF